MCDQGTMCGKKLAYTQGNYSFCLIFYNNNPTGAEQFVNLQSTFH